MMKALFLEAKNSPPHCMEFEMPLAGEGEAIVSLKAASLNHRDVWIAKGMYPGLRFPIIPGSDGAGLCEGREVVIQPGKDWGNDERFQGAAYQILGLPQHGTFAEQVVVRREQLYPKPPHLSMEQAAALPLAGLTAYRVLVKRCQAVQGEKLLVTGAGGGVAMFCVQFALTMGLEVFVTSGSEEKLARASALGVAGGANYKLEGWHDELKRLAGGFDVIIDGTGGEQFSQLVKLANPGARIGIYGSTNGAMSFSPQPVFWKQLSILGTTMGSDLDFAGMLDFVNRHQLVPQVDSVFELQNGAAAFERMDKGAQYGKIVLKIN